MVELLKALSDENRLRILNLLFCSELCVCEIETILDISQSNASRHLSKLKSNQIISASKDAQWVHYKVSDDFLLRYQGLVGDLKVYFQSNEMFQNDLKRYNNYVVNGLTCTDIRKDIQHVLQMIQ